MKPSRITQQTTTQVPLGRAGGTSYHEPSSDDSQVAALQWAFEGPAWSWLRPIVDFVLLCAAVVVALGGPESALHPTTLSAPLLALPPLVVLLFYLRGLYHPRLRALALDEIVPLISAVSVAAMTVAMMGLFLNGQIPPQSDWVRVWLFALFAACCGRLALLLTRRWARAHRLVGKPVMILGAGVVGVQVAQRLEAHPEYGLIPVGFIDEDPRTSAEVGRRNVPVLGTISSLDQALRLTGVRHLIVAFSSVADARVSRLIDHCQRIGVEVSVVPRMFDTINNRVKYDNVGGLPLMSFSAVNPNGVQFAIKHALDRILALLFLVALSPVMLLAAVGVRLSSPGPILFRQRRVGRDGHAFDFYKFRSMRLPDPSEAALEEDYALDFLLRHDTAPGGVEGQDRRTAVGRLMRRLSIDELPQLLNVLRGDMSLVGPRPERPEFVELFGQENQRYGDRHRVKSGITGWAQVHGLRGQTSLAERVEWDNYYIANWSLGLDLKILALTLGVFFHDAE